MNTHISPADRVLPDGVAATLGGTFDPAAPLMYFIAGAMDATAATPHPNVLVAVNELTNAKDLDLLDRLCDERKVLLDSGIFNLSMTHAITHGTSHDVGLSMPPEEIDGFEQLWDRYGQVVTRFGDRLWGAVELDQGGVENKPRTRARIEAEFGIIPMPVYHPLLDGWDYYDDLAAGYDRICFGNIVKASPSARLRLAYTAAERAKEYPYLWTHLLGMTVNQNLIAMPFKGSCDSSSWLGALRWQPQWRATAMTATMSKYPSTMWDIAGSNHTGANLNHVSQPLTGLTAASLQITVDSLREDTHPWL